MRTIYRLYLLGALLMVLCFTQAPWVEASHFNRISSTLDGGSGLLVTQSIDTVPPGKFELGLGLSYEEGDAALVDYSLTRLAPTLSVGLSPTLDLSAQVPYFLDVEIGNTGERDLGDLNLALKWRFMEPSADFNFPGFAFSLTAFFPTGAPDIGAGNVDSWGLKTLLIMSAETEIGRSRPLLLAGFYADGGMYIQDLGDRTEERSGIIDLGMLIPLNQSRTMQLILEGNGRIKRELLLEREYVAITGGVRYVGRHLALNGGWQHRFNQGQFEDSERLILYGSYLF